MSKISDKVLAKSWEISKMKYAGFVFLRLIFISDVNEGDYLAGNVEINEYRDHDQECPIN